MKCHLTYSNKHTAASMKYQAMELGAPDNVTIPFVLNERFHSFLQAKERLLGNEVIRII
ncbi:hypothetical protein [Candidatus Enterovibrio altilux]|uniref:hypothetical protein n=1 Tax=Candidatus Enterovibrio altilux TaxID=1927128 RepID=UPI001374819C|nr:hypothetical protein [Candidatus Enterovibrio luxaltus]